MIKFTYSANFFYYNCSKRIKEKMDSINQLIDEYAYTSSRLAANRNTARKPKISRNAITLDYTKEFSRALNNKITQRNPNFITPALTEDILNFCKPEEDFIRQLNIDGIDSCKYEFESVSEIYWGTDEELYKNEELFFYAIIKDMLNSIDDKNFIESILIDYVPYAYLTALNEIDSSLPPNAVSIFDYYPDLPNLKETQKTLSEAISRLYQQFKNQYSLTDMFFDFLSKNKKEVEFKNMQTEFKNFVNMYLKPRLKHMVTDENSLGKRVYELFKVDGGIYITSQIFQTTISQPNKDLLDATIDYCNTLRNIQLEQENGLQSLSVELENYTQSIALSILALDKYPTGVTTIDKLLEKFESHSGGDLSAFKRIEYLEDESENDGQIYKY
ncbi:TPA: hypothetical protein ACG19U_000977 [Streptococcus agalactiae]